MTLENTPTTDGNDRRPLVLLTGATGYVGGRLLNVLESSGYRLRCLARRPGALRARAAPETEIVAGDALDPASLDVAMQGAQTAYYLVHSMGAGGDFEDKDRQAARNFGEAARAAGVKQIIYLGGLGESDGPLSPHLRSRREVGRVLRESGVPVIEFRASIVIGSGSLSFEMIRALTERLPVMIAPRWVATPAQPIAIEDVLAYLIEALKLQPGQSRIFEIGGADHASYGEIIQEYARQRGLRRVIIPVPVLTPRLSSLWLGLVTPVYARIGRKLIESLRHPTVVRDRSALQVFGVRPRGIREAIARALLNEDRAFAETRWSDAFSSGGRLGELGRRSLWFAIGGITRRAGQDRLHPGRSSRFGASAAGPAGTTAIGCGGSEGFWICWSAASDCGAGVAILNGCVPERRSIAGASKRSSRTDFCGWRRR